MRLSDTLPSLESATDIIGGTDLIRDELLPETEERATLVHFWSGDVELSIAMLEDFNAAIEGFKERMNVISVHTSSDDLETQDIKEAAKEYGLTHTVMIDGNNEIRNLFELQFVPSYFLFDSNQTLVHYQAGGGGMKMLKKQLEKVVGKK